MRDKAIRDIERENFQKRNTKKEGENRDNLGDNIKRTFGKIWKKIKTEKHDILTDDAKEQLRKYGKRKESYA